MTNKELAVQLLNMIDRTNPQTDIMISTVMRLLDEPEQTEPVEEKKEPVQKAPAKKPKNAAPKKELDWGKAKACFDAGWDLAKIADEIGCTVAGVKYHFKKEGLLK